MQVISSVSNPIIADVRKLNNSRQFRYECRKFVAEGVNIVKDIPNSYISTLFLTKSTLEKYDWVEDKCSEIILVTDKVMGAMSDTKSPSGVLAVCNMPTETNNDSKQVVLLDNLADPGNAGTIIRTAVACGVSEIWLYGDCVDMYSPKVVRSSMGGIFHVNVKQVSLNEIIGEVYALDMAGENIYKIENMPKEFVLVVGSEAHGVSREIRERADKILSLPMCGNMESLNAGVSLSIALYHLINGGK